MSLTYNNKSDGRKEKNVVVSPWTVHNKELQISMKRFDDIIDI
jgi:hypothetical protein